MVRGRFLHTSAFNFFDGKLDRFSTTRVFVLDSHAIAI